jgi:hypothetical protein
MGECGEQGSIAAARVRKLILKEADDRCAFCSMEDISALEIRRLERRKIAEVYRYEKNYRLA